MPSSALRSLRALWEETVPNQTPGAGFQGLNGFTRISGPNVQTKNAYWGFPLVEGRFPLLRISVVSPAEIQQRFAAAQVTPIAGRGCWTSKSSIPATSSRPG